MFDKFFFHKTNEERLLIGERSDTMRNEPTVPRRNLRSKFLSTHRVREPLVRVFVVGPCVYLVCVVWMCVIVLTYEDFAQGRVKVCRVVYVGIRAVEDVGYVRTRYLHEPMSL